MTIEQLRDMGHKGFWLGVIWGKEYIFARDHEGSWYMAKVNADGTLAVL